MEETQMIQKRKTTFFMFFSALAVMLLVASCSGPNISQSTKKILSSDYRAPADILQVLLECDTQYLFMLQDTSVATNLVRYYPEKFSISGDINTRLTDYMTYELYFEESTEEVYNLQHEAEEYLVAGDAEKAIELYKKAHELDPDYSELVTYLGNIYFMMKDYENAEKYLKKACELNPNSYMPHFFLADTYYMTDRRKEALDEITYAFMLNKNNVNMVDVLHRVLMANGKQIRRDRLVFPYEVTQQGRDSFNIVLDSAQVNYLSFANCMAAWKIPEYQAALNDSIYGMQAEAFMCTECFINLLMSLDGAQGEDKTLSVKDEIIYEMLSAGYIDSIIYWEIMAGEAPLMIMTLPDESKSMIFDYIQEYVFEDI
jgi:tetratricopeptide (TPR) repeat protein